MISWETAPGAEVQKFVVERAAGGGTWEAIASTGAANKSAAPVYSVTDVAPATGANLYRLQTVDLDGSRSFSATKKVSFNGAPNGVEIYPNPATDILHFVPAGENSKGMRICILNTMSQPVLMASVSDKEALNLDVSSLTPGIYFVRVVLEDGTTHVTRFTKQ